MVRENIVTSIKQYLNSDQWKKFIEAIIRTDDPVFHIHLYIENRIHPDSLSKLLTKYHAKKGIILDRGIKYSGLPDVGMLINVQPVDSVTGRFLANYEIFWFYNPDVFIAPAEVRPDADLNKTPLYRDVQEDNLWTWGKSYMDEYYKQFDFKCVGPNEETEINAYFKSDHFRKWLRLMEDSPADHIHCNVEINFDPGILKMYAVEALKELGIKVDWVIPNVYRVPEGDRGKLIFLSAHPEWQHDICWAYNPDVVIRPATKPFVGQRLPEDGDFRFDFNLHSDFEDVLAAGDYVKLSDEEVEEILKAI
jgi:hypothetical protein